MCMCQWVTLCIDFSVRSKLLADVAVCSMTWQFVVHFWAS